LVTGKGMKESAGLMNYFAIFPCFAEETTSVKKSNHLSVQSKQHKTQHERNAMTGASRGI
jgi:hypothetical protein